jgi:hypothetical protein
MTSYWTAHCTLLTAHCTLHTAHCSLPTAHCSLLSAYCLVPTAFSSLVPLLNAGPESVEVLVKATAEEDREVFIPS